MATTKSFDQYTVTLSGGVEGRVGLLMCYSGNSFVGRIDFYPDGTALTQDYLWHPAPIGEYIVLHMPMSRFEAVMATVRQEKPLQLYINVNRSNGATTSGYGSLTTSEKEPIGEEEGTV
ncbi:MULTISPECIES: hypothetical protein [Leptolyngbya]|uniref:hypothetical protein n=1 Tax=Leptolyngbya TaxID=47251 RepID=UPI0016853845|nr:hypothetical protein [Leptolyngbya sp. FACHB-1624]MBD1856434.1 hypothetical protein [Leptolyngbya sp. FACHB-1624]